VSGLGDDAIPESSLSQLDRLATGELLRRLEDDEEAAKLPGTGLLNLVLLIQKQKEPEKKPEDTADLDVLEIVKNTDLPEERKQELIKAERERLTERLRELED
jgi:hypothetical protein